MNLPDLLKATLDLGGSDLHLSIGSPPQVRVDGHLRRLEVPDLTPDTSKALAYSVLTDAQKKKFEETQELDLAFGLRGVGRFRCNVFNQKGAVGAVYRLIPEKIRSLEELNLPPILAELADRPRGLVLVTGPTGSGKSTTLAAMIDRINLSKPVHILTIEDPIEYLHHHKKALVNQRELHADTHGFNAALRAALREDPDVIVIGELRDLETISLALSAAETGHLVLGTLHTQGAVRTINRLVGAYPPSQQAQVRTMLSESLRATISQKLIPRSDRKGMALAYELLLVNVATSNLIRENRTFQLASVLQTGRSKGMRSMDDSLTELVQKGMITKKEAALHAEDARLFKGS